MLLARRRRRRRHRRRRRARIAANARFLHISSPHILAPLLAIFVAVNIDTLDANRIAALNVSTLAKSLGDRRPPQAGRRHRRARSLKNASLNGRRSAQLSHRAPALSKTPNVALRLLVDSAKRSRQQRRTSALLAHHIAYFAARTPAN